MKAQELLKPRFEIIADFPNNYLGKIGDILEEKGLSKFWKISDYPHLFRKLNWWELRKKEDMPKKLICKAIKDDNEIMEILDWDMKNLFGWTDIENRKGCGLLSFNPEYGYFPVD